MGLIISILVNAIALLVAARFVPNIEFPAAQEFPNTDLVPLLAVALLFGVINAIIKPILGLLSLPIQLVTLGLFSFVINASMILILAFVSDVFGFVFKLAEFPPTLSADAFLAALLGSIVISIVSTALGLFVKSG